MDTNIAKKTVAEAAVKLIENGMVVGLGTGSTTFFFIQALIANYHEGLNISVVATSEASKQQAIKGGIPFQNINELTSIDLTVDGADEIDDKKRMIKGGGGALLREKIVASMSHEMIVIVDETKRVKLLGKFPLPVEIVPFAYRATIQKIEALGYQGSLRQKDSQNYVTDNGNLIFDIHFKELCIHPEEIHQRIKTIPGVVETGFFFNLAGRVLVGYHDGSVKHM